MFFKFFLRNILCVYFFHQASLSDRAIEVYKYMFDNSIGHQIAAVYVEWALTLEINGNRKEADTVYTEGLNRLAQPHDLLKQKRQ